MKTLEIKDVLKKGLLVVELPRKGDVEVFPNSIEIYNKFTGQEDTIEGSYTILGRPNKIEEEDAFPLIEKVMNGQHFQNYKARKENDFANLWCKTATDSLLSAIESEIYWNVNPEGKFPRYAFDENINPKDIKARAYHQKWHEAESLTFDRNRTLIFIKN